MATVVNIPSDPSATIFDLLDSSNLAPCFNVENICNTSLLSQKDLPQIQKQKSL